MKSIKLFFREFEKKLLIQNAISILVIFIILISIDQVTKNGFYPGQPTANLGKELHNWFFLAVRTYGHKGITSGLTTNIALIQFLSVLIIIGFTSAALYSKSSFRTIATTFIIAGTMGNFIDRIIFDGFVKDIFFLPFYDKGTFNLADIMVGLGTFLVFSSLILDFSLKNKKLSKKM